MTSISHIITYILLFLSLYFEVFMLVTYLEHKDDINAAEKKIGREPKRFPSVSIIVPCWNEAGTIGRTVESLLALDYPQDKLDIILVDDGSTDDTWNVMQKYTLPEAGPRVNDFALGPASGISIRAFQKMNGGKHTALNLGLEKSSSELVGCLDADSYVDPRALKEIILYFEDHPQSAVVTPSMKIWQPKNIIQAVQAIEYIWSIFLRKMYSYLGTIYVTPGPFSIFRREIFSQVGTYRPAHMTEDMEMAMRLQKHHLKIGHAHTAIVHTQAPNTVKKLYKQRLRWTYGFIRNTADYRDMFFKSEYGNFGMFIMPIAVFSTISALFVALMSINGYWTSFYDELVKIRAVGWHMSHIAMNFDWFYINTEIISVASFATLVLMLIILIISRSMAGEARPTVRTASRYGLELVYFMVVYAILAPVWVFKALYNAVFSVATQWR